MSRSRLSHSMRLLVGGGVALLLLAVGAPATASHPFPPDLVDKAIARADKSVQNILAIPTEKRTFENTVGAVDDVIAQMELDTNMFLFQAYVSPDADLRESAQAGDQQIRDWRIELSKNEDLYKAIKQYAGTDPKLLGEHRRYLEESMRDYRRAGMELPPDEREKLKAIQKEISRLAIEFDKNIQDDETVVPLTKEELVGMSDEYLEGLTKSGNIYLVGLSYPEFLPLGDYCENETTRQKVWLAYKRRGGRANIKVLEDMVAKRAEAAKILGYESTAAYEIETKMAKTPKAIEDFYRDVRPLVRKKALKDWEEFTEAKRRHTGNPEAVLRPWDFDFYDKLLQREKYAVDMEEVRQYFPLDRVNEGLFAITQSLFGIEFRDVTEHERKAGNYFWHEDVKLYEVWDKDQDRRLGNFYIDLHPRPNKYGHAAQWGLAQHKIWSNGKLTEPLAALVCNFTKPTADKPSLLDHDEVETYFHEFGHCLHTLLSEAEMFSFAGTSVERDFVEAPSQMLENWVWDPDVLQTFAKHWKTGEPIPRRLVDGMVAARHLGSGLKTERQIFYGLYDFTLHSDPEGDLDSTELGLDLWGGLGEGVELYEAVPETWFQSAFGHLTGYQAGYYGYQWSLVYACDMFERFRELGVLDGKAGRYYRNTILAKGGTEDGLDLVRGYLDREPDMSAYLRHLGLDEAP